MVLRLTPIFYRRPCNADRQTALHSSLRKKGEYEKLASLGETPEGGTSSRKTPEGETSSEETSVKEGSKSDVETIQDETPGERKTDISELTVKTLI